MNRRPIPVRSFKTDVYGTSLAIGPKMPPVDRTKPSPGVENPITKRTRSREEQQLRDFQREQAERREQREQAERREKNKQDRELFIDMLETIEKEDIEGFKKLFYRADYDARMMYRDGRYPEYELEEKDDWGSKQIEQTVPTHAFVYDNPEIFQILLVNEIDSGLDFVRTAIKNFGRSLSEEGKIMKKMLDDYDTYVNYFYASSDKEETKKKNALRRLQKRNPETGTVTGSRGVVTTEEWNAEKGIGAL